MKRVLLSSCLLIAAILTSSSQVTLGEKVPNFSAIDQDGEKWVKLGCFTRKLSDWESDFWNNDNEFPNDGSEDSKLRVFAYETAKRWFNLV